MYNFQYVAVTPASDSDAASYLSVEGHTMTGITPTLCSLSSIFTIEFPVYEGDEIQTLGDEFGAICGYYVEYIWSGYDSVTFDINTNSGLQLAVSAFSLFVLGVFNF